MLMIHLEMASLSFQDINLVIQTTLLVVVLASMAFRFKGNYLAHGATMIAAVAAQLVGLLTVIATAKSSEMTPLLSPTLHVGIFSFHAAIGAAAIASGLWLVALWRPHATAFPEKSKVPAYVTLSLWVTTYVVGILLLSVLHWSFLA